MVCGVVILIAIGLGFFALGPTGEYVKSITNNSFLQGIGTIAGDWFIDLGASIRTTLMTMGLIALGVIAVWYRFTNR